MLSSLSVSYRPESRLRHWCSSIYLRIPPLHMEFHSPLLHSRKTVSDAIPRLSRGLSHLTYLSACARFTPNKSGQRLPPTYYRGCWHVVSRDFLVDYRQIMSSYSHYLSSPTTELYDPKTFFTHAALLHQASAHCAITSIWNISCFFSNGRYYIASSFFFKGSCYWFKKSYIVAFSSDKCSSHNIKLLLMV